MDFSDIKRFPNIHYRIDVPWDFLDEQLRHYSDTTCGQPLDICPDFQRGHVWTEEQQIAYVEFMLKEPQSGRELYLNHPNWMGSFKGEFVLVDGLQRLTAALKYIHGEIPAFGFYLKDMTLGKRTGINALPTAVSFSINIAKLKTRAEVLQWYLDFNAGGTPHAKSEIERVRELLYKEKGETQP